MASLAGTTIDKYEMIEEVGWGGMAVVYRGLDRVLKREVAVKVLHPHLADRTESKLRLEREAIAVAKLRHENILEIFDYSGPDAAQSYIVTEFIHGPTLKAWVDDSLEPRPVVAAMIVHRLCLALSHAHKAAIVHRDIKPENVMIRKQDGVLKLMDFGIAQIIDNQKLTLTGQLIGSPAYMAPELISGKPLDARTDLFSLGILLYQLATGELPFSGRNPHEVLNRIADGEYPAPSSICPMVDRDLEAIIDRALATNPDDRYQSVDTLGKDLEEYCLDLEIEPGPEELARYFTDPAGYVRTLDERVCATMMRQAEEAAKEGASARAIRLLGRVLELDSEHKGARQLLQRVRVRERRIRHLLVAAAGLAVVGLGAAGYMLIGPGDPASGSALAHSGDLTPPDPAPPRDDDDGVVARDDRSADDAADPDPTSVIANDDDAVAADTTPDDTDAKAGRPGTKSRMPVRTNPGVKASSQSCAMELAGIPVNTIKSKIRVKAGTEVMDLTERTFAVTLVGDSMLVKLDDDKFQGSVQVSREACASSSPVVLNGRPKPAKLTFSGIPGKISVRCTKGCKNTGTHFAEGFPDIEMGSDINKAITLEFKHADYQEKTQDFTIVPGLNPLPVDLKPRGSG